MNTCRDAVAYLKMEVLSDDGPVVELSHDDSPVLKTLGQGLLAAYLVDEGPNFRYVPNRECAPAGFDTEELHRVGIMNLAALAQTELEVRSYRGIFVALMGGNFEASMILVDTFWEEVVPAFLPGPIVAAFPARDILSFGEAGSPAVMAELEAVIGRTFPDGDHLLSDKLHVRRERAWVPL